MVSPGIPPCSRPCPSGTPQRIMVGSSTTPRRPATTCLHAWLHPAGVSQVSYPIHPHRAATPATNQLLTPNRSLMAVMRLRTVEDQRPRGSHNDLIGGAPAARARTAVGVHIEHLFVTRSSAPFPPRGLSARGRPRQGRLEAPLCGRALPGPGPGCPLARDGSGAGKAAGASVPAGAVGCVAGPGVACPKSRCAGCKPAALDPEWCPGCPPGLWAVMAAARRASAWRQAKMASLICRFRRRKASLPVLPWARFLS
jgi:hypothetical protein